MRQLLRAVLLTGYVSNATGCRPVEGMSMAAPAEIPQQVRCFAGPALQRAYSGDVNPATEAAARGPWLVLDTLRRGRDRATSAPLCSGLLVERRDSVERILGSWMVAAADSIVFREGAVIPPGDWYFRVIGDSLHGIGVLVHDVVSRNPDGTVDRHVSRWRVRLAIVPCRAVPT